MVTTTKAELFALKDYILEQFMLISEQKKNNEFLEKKLHIMFPNSASQLLLLPHHKRGPILDNNIIALISTDIYHHHHHHNNDNDNNIIVNNNNDNEKKKNGEEKEEEKGEDMLKIWKSKLNDGVKKHAVNKVELLANAISLQTSPEIKNELRALQSLNDDLNNNQFLKKYDFERLKATLHIHHLTHAISQLNHLFNLISYFHYFSPSSPSLSPSPPSPPLIIPSYDDDVGDGDYRCLMEEGEEEEEDEEEKEMREAGFQNKEALHHQITELEKDIEYYSSKNKEEEKRTAESELSTLQQLNERLNSPMTRTKHMIKTLMNAQSTYHFMNEEQLDHLIRDLEIDLRFHERKKNEAARNDCESKLNELRSIKVIYCEMKTEEVQIWMKELEIAKYKKRFHFSSEHQLLIFIAHSFFDLSFYHRNQQIENEEMEKSKLLVFYHLRSLLSSLQSNCFHLASNYENGSGVEKNESKAVEWYMKAADHGHASAMLNLGLMYAKGNGVVKNESKAVEWYMKAADHGHASAMLNLGLMYAKGNGVVKNESKAVEWFMKAADRGFIRV